MKLKIILGLALATLLSACGKEQAANVDAVTAPAQTFQMEAGNKLA